MPFSGAVRCFFFSFSCRDAAPAVGPARFYAMTSGAAPRDGRFLYFLCFLSRASGAPVCRRNRRSPAVRNYYLAGPDFAESAVARCPYLLSGGTGLAESAVARCPYLLSSEIAAEGIYLCYSISPNRKCVRPYILHIGTVTAILMST